MPRVNGDEYSLELQYIKLLPTLVKLCDETNDMVYEKSDEDRQELFVSIAVNKLKNEIVRMLVTNGHYGMVDDR